MLYVKHREKLKLKTNKIQTNEGCLLSANHGEEQVIDLFFLA